MQYEKIKKKNIYISAIYWGYLLGHFGMASRRISQAYCIKAFLESLCSLSHFNFHITFHMGIQGKYQRQKVIFQIGETNNCVAHMAQLPITAS